jgi:signal transduction histidine kinase
VRAGAEKRPESRDARNKIGSRSSDNVSSAVAKETTDYAREAGDLVDRAIALAGFRGERILSMARGLFCLAILARSTSFVIEQGAWGFHAFFGIPSAAFAIAFSLYMVLRGWRRHERTWLLSASTTVDAVVCFVELVPNSLWPAAGYTGLLRVPDTAALLIITAVSGVRLSPRAALWSAALNMASLSVLIAIDVNRSRIVYPDDAGQLSLFAIYLAAAIAIAQIVAVRTRRIVMAGAEQAVAAEQTKQKLHALLQDHHDVRTVLSSATLNADLAMQAATHHPDGGSVPELPERLEQVREDLRQIGHFVAAVREQAQEELRFQRERVPVDAEPVIESVLTPLRRQFPGVRMAVESAVSRPVVATGGGARTLERVLLNLIVNACQGDGVAGARHVRVRIEPSDRVGWLRFSVVDDGPGFPADALALCGDRAFTTKPAGTGIGLLLTTSLLKANGSRLECANRPMGGGVATFDLPLAGALAHAPSAIQSAAL